MSKEHGKSWGKDHDEIFLTQVDSILVMLVYISLFIAYNLLASCFSFMNYSSKEFRQFIVSPRESIIERLELFICVISFFSSRIFYICFDISCRSRSRCSWSSFLRWIWRCLSTSSCSSFWTLRMRLSILTRRCDSSEQILLTRLEKQVAVLSQTLLKNMTASKSSVKSWTLLSGSYLCRILTISSFFAFLISSARLITSSFISISPLTFLPILLTRIVYWLTISAQMASILILDLFVISSMKSRMANFALSERMFRMCLLFTKLEFLIVGMIDRSLSVGTNLVDLVSFLGCLNRTMRLLSIKYFRNFCSSSSKRKPLSVFSYSIFLSSLWQSQMDRSGSALLMIMITPSLMSSKVLKDFSRFLVSLGSLSALASLM